MTENPLGYEKISKLLKNFAVPSIVASLVGSIYNIVDQIFIGQGVGYLGNAATNVAYPFSTICLAIALLVGIGSASRVSLCLGRKEPKAAAKAAGNGIVLMGIFGIIYLLVGETFLSLLLKAFGATTDVFPYAKQYASITLIGMPGVGKSTIGVVLAKVLGYQFLDSDLLIQKQENRRLWQIIEEEGYEGFQNVENRVNASIEAENTVIATGGSVVYCEEAMKHLKSVGTVVYLKLSLNSLAKRLGNLKGRGVLLREGQTLESLYEERTPLYEKYADITIDEENKNLEETLQSIVDSLELNSEDTE